MTSIHDITGLPPEYKKVQQKDGPHRPPTGRKVVTENRLGTGPPQSAAQVDISESGKRLLQQKQEVAHYLEELHRLERDDLHGLETIREKVGNDFYSRPEVIDKIVESLLALPEFQRDSREGFPAIPGAPDAEIDERRRAEIRQNIKNGVYQRDSVLDALVEKLLESGQLKL
jgi:hypothetical protein